MCQASFNASGRAGNERATNSGAHNKPGKKNKGLLESLTRRLIRTEWSLVLVAGNCQYEHNSLWEVIALVGSRFKPFSTVLFLGIHNYGPQHLDDAVAFLSRTCSKYPYEELISPPYKLADFFTALQVSQKQTYYRVCVKPWGSKNWWIVTERLRVTARGKLMNLNWNKY